MTDGESTDLRNFLPAEKSRTAEPEGSSRPTKKKGSRQARVAHVGVDLLGSDGFFFLFLFLLMRARLELTKGEAERSGDGAGAEKEIEEEGEELPLHAGSNPAHPIRLSQR